MRKLRKCCLIAKMLDEAPCVREAHGRGLNFTPIVLVGATEDVLTIGSAYGLFGQHESRASCTGEPFRASISTSREVIEHETKLNHNAAQSRFCAGISLVIASVSPRHGDATPKYTKHGESNDRSGPDSRHWLRPTCSCLEPTKERLDGIAVCAAEAALSSSDAKH